MHSEIVNRQLVGMIDIRYTYQCQIVRWFKKTIIYITPKCRPAKIGPLDDTGATSFGVRFSP